jgi:hypothetical protein
MVNTPFFRQAGTTQPSVSKRSLMEVASMSSNSMILRYDTESPIWYNLDISVLLLVIACTLNPMYNGRGGSRSLVCRDWPVFDCAVERSLAFVLKIIVWHTVKHG